MCGNIDWNTLLLTTATCGFASLITAFAGAKWGAEYAFENDEEINRKRKEKEELENIYKFYGHLLSLYNGYDSWANSFIQLSNGFRIENNISKIKNLSSNEWGILCFIAENSLELYEQIFKLERDTDIAEEKTTIYANQDKKDASSRSHIIAQKQFIGVYAEIIMMIFSINNYTRTYYKKVLITSELERRLIETKDKINKMVKSVIGTQPTSEDNKTFLKIMKDKKDWYLTFDKIKKTPEILKNWIEI